MTHPTLPSGADPSGEPPPKAAPTLYVARLSDPRERAALPRERTRGKAVSRAEPTSDLTRFRGLVVATVVGASAAIAAALLLPPPGGHASPGPLSRPHAKAKLECAACHGAQDRATALGASSANENRNKVPNSACTACHGSHGSLRRGHEKATAAGLMSCATCHPIHKSDQGVTFFPSAAPLRFAVGVETEVPGVGYHSTPPATVALPSVGSCRKCHDVASSSDPIHHCLLGGQEALGDKRPIVCFDEHQPALPDDGIRSSGRGRGPGPAGVCAGQHTSDRALAWDAAREVAARVPVLERATLSGTPLLWTGLGLLAAALTLAGARGGHALAARRRRKAQAPPPTEMLQPAHRVRLPQIDVNTCLGCYACVDACPYDVLEIERYVAKVSRPEACCGLTLCEQRCPNGSLRITDGEPIGDRPRLGPELESQDVPGLFLAGDITGLPLIKNAIHQGAHAADKIAESLKKREAGAGDALDLLIVGAGPAGISAALKAKELGLRFEVIEQGNVAQSIQSFPRGKLVFDQPLELPVTGKLWLKESTKEELLSHWLRIVRKERLPIFADTRMIKLEREPSGLFRITTEPREGGPTTERRARRVLLAIGQRGSPRRLPFELEPEVEARVHYHLADARSFEDKRVIVVGLGDVAMETAIALSRQPSTRVTLVHRAEGFTRGKARNIAETRRLIEAGRIQIRWKSEPIGISREQVLLKTPNGEQGLGYDAVMVMIGSIPPGRVLGEAGVRTVADLSPGADPPASDGRSTSP